MTLVRALAAAAVTALLGALAMPAVQAAPSSTRVAAVFQLPCRDTVCNSEDDRDVDSGAVVGNWIQFHVGSKSAIGLQYVALQVRYGTSGSFSCLKYWNANNSTNFNTYYSWNTTTLPSDCPDGAATQPSRNGLYQFRVVARENVSGETQVSSLFAVNVNNRPSAPSWAGELSASGEDARQPSVRIRFTGAPEPDVLEYHFVRVAPNGTQEAFAISAARPGGQGCELEGSTYVCDDDTFPSSGFAGTYSYALVALRSSPQGDVQCVLPPEGSCLLSSFTAAKQITLREPPPASSPTPTPSDSSSPSASPSPRKAGTKVLAARRSSSGGRNNDWRDFYTGTYDPKLPYSERGGAFVPGTLPSEQAEGEQVASGDFAGSSEPLDQRQLWLSVAGGLVLLLVAAHISRTLRARDAA